jgi:peroxiredoxin
MNTRAAATLLGALLMGLMLSAPAAAQNAIDFELEDLSGSPVRLSDHLGEQVILVNFWATWCVPCARELVHVQRFQEEYADDGLLILAVSVDGPSTRSQVGSYVEQHRHTFPVLVDEESRVVALYNPSLVLPYTVLIDRQGVVRYSHQGYSPGDEEVVEQHLTELLAEEQLGRSAATSFQLMQSSVYRGFSDEDVIASTRAGRSSQIINQLDLTATRSDWLLGLRADTRFDYSPSSERIGLSQRFLEYQRGDIGFRIGDFYHSIGRGLSFSLLKIFEDEGLENVLDTTVDGGRLSARSGPWSGELFGGSVDVTDLEADDSILGAKVGWSGVPGLDIQLSHVDAQVNDNTFAGTGDVSLQTVGVRALGGEGKSRFRGEFTRINNGTLHADRQVEGHGAYLEYGISPGNASILLLLKDYKNLAYRYNRPPSLESEDLEFLARHFDTESIDIQGASLRLDYRFPGRPTIVRGTVSYFNDGAGDSPLAGPYEREITHYVAGVEQYFGENGYLKVITGLRSQSTSPIALLTDGDTFHYQFNVNFPLSRRISLEADWKSLSVNGGPADWSDQQSFLSLHHSPIGVATILFERTDNPEDLFVSDRTDWWAGQIEWHITPANSIRLFAGATKGSVRCSGGVCGYFPPFEGVRLETILKLR